MGKTVFYYRMFCETENDYVYVWNDKRPSKCPNSSAHTIRNNSVTITRRVAQSDVKVLEEDPDDGGVTGGHFAVKSLPMTIGPSETKTATHTWPHAISVFAIEFISSANQLGDVVDVYINPEATIGALSGDVASGATVLPVTDSVLVYARVGFEITLDDGVNNEALGAITAIDTATNEITVETATTNAFAAATPTAVKMTVHMMQNYTFGHGGPVNIGESKIGGSYIPANTPIRVVYQNKTAETKHFNPSIEYLY